MLRGISRRLWALLSFSSILVVLAAFVYFTYRITQPVERVAKRPLAEGVVVAAAALRSRGPLSMYVALHAGSAVTQTSLVDDLLTERDGRFVLRSDAVFGPRFLVLARVETPSEEEYCTIRRLPPLRVNDDGDWGVIVTGRPLPPLRLEVGLGGRCEGLRP